MIVPFNRGWREGKTAWKTDFRYPKETGRPVRLAPTLLAPFCSPPANWRTLISISSSQERSASSATLGRLITNGRKTYSVGHISGSWAEARATYPGRIYSTESGAPHRLFLWTVLNQTGPPRDRGSQQRALQEDEKAPQSPNMNAKTGPRKEDAETKSIFHPLARRRGMPIVTNEVGWDETAGIDVLMNKYYPSLKSRALVPIATF